MKYVLPVATMLLTLTSALFAQAAAQTPPAVAPSELAALRADSSETEQAAALEAVKDWLERDFGQARAELVARIGDPALPPDLRSRLLRSAIEAARAQAQLGFDGDAAPAYRDLVERLPAGPERSRLHQAYGNLSLARGQFAASESLYRQAVTEDADRDLAERANLRSSLGVALAQQGRLDDALSAMLQAYRLYEQTPAGPSTDLLRNIGGLSIYLEDWEQAVTFSRLAIDKLGPDDPTVAGVYSNLAAALTEQGNLEAALEALQTGMALAEAAGQPSASVISNLGYVLRELDRPEDALAHFERAAELNRAASDVGSLAISMKNIGETLILLDRRRDADVALQASLAAYREADIKPKRLELYPVLVDNLEQLEQYPQALALMREYRALTEELASAEAQARVAELQTAFDLERKERELAESERERLARETELASLQAEQSRQRLVRALLVAGVVALGLFLLLVLRSLLMRTRANRLLAEKNAEIDLQHTALGETNALLHRQSIEDELTGLGNRRSVRQMLESESPSTLRRRPALLVLIDLDRFKGINDRFGHSVGDRVLAEFANVLRTVAGPEDVLARWGGEEFLWLVADADMADAAERCRILTERVRAAEFEVGSRRLSITCSMGATPVDLDVDDPQAAFDLALKIADAALYEAKESGRNGWAGFQRHGDDPSRFEGSLDIAALVASGALVRKRLQP
ncbi:MAG: hypothetical protein CMP07_10030 [Xanthomonadales bacterium]|nr:hypothetical protein [Xanthomonadales bacterium]